MTTKKGHIIDTNIEIQIQNIGECQLNLFDWEQIKYKNQEYLKNYPDNDITKNSLDDKSNNLFINKVQSNVFIFGINKKDKELYIFSYNTQLGIKIYKFGQNKNEYYFNGSLMLENYNMEEFLNTYDFYITSEFIREKINKELKKNCNILYT